jgi:hypothetical protein
MASDAIANNSVRMVLPVFILVHLLSVQDQLFYMDNTARAMRIDQLWNVSYPLSRKLEKQSHLRDMFSRITYNKVTSNFFPLNE